MRFYNMDQGYCIVKFEHSSLVCQRKNMTFVRSKLFGATWKGSDSAAIETLDNPASGQPDIHSPIFTSTVEFDSSDSRKLK